MDIKYDIEALIDIDGKGAPPRKRSFVCSFTPVSFVISHLWRLIAARTISGIRDV